jgi:hypothetical protein
MPTKPHSRTTDQEDDVVVSEERSDPRTVERIWNQIEPMLGVPGVLLTQFVALMSVFINETGGSFSKGAERVGSPGHAGLSYAFDSFQITDRTGRTFTKASYNQAPKNRTAFALFHDPVYLTSHGTLQPTAQTTRDLSAWKGTTWPSGVPTVLDQGQTGFLQEADFFKFRGRGFIQTTWRPAYEAIIAVIKAYGGTQAVAVDYKARWISMTTGDAATTSSNADWDHLFQDSDMVIPMVAIRTHNQAGGNYLTLSDQPAGMKGTGPGSFANVGTRISGDGAYGATLRSQGASAQGGGRSRRRALWRRDLVALRLGRLLDRGDRDLRCGG